MSAAKRTRESTTQNAPSCATDDLFRWSQEGLPFTAVGGEGLHHRVAVDHRELVEMLFAKAPLELDPIFEDDWKRASNDAERLRVVIDQIASLTDPGAYALHLHLSGAISGKRG